MAWQGSGRGEHCIWAPQTDCCEHRGPFQPPGPHCHEAEVCQESGASLSLFSGFCFSGW